MKIDTPIIVWDNPAFGKYKMHFAGWTHDGQVQVWRGGRTSFSGTSKQVWKNWRAYFTGIDNIPGVV